MNRALRLNWSGRRSKAATAMVLGLLASGSALGMRDGDGASSGPGAAAPAPVSTEPAPLAGPKVDVPADRSGTDKGGGASGDSGEMGKPRTLIERDFEGKLKRLEVMPAVAALELLDLSEEERAATREILDERNALMDELVRDHLKEIAQIAAAAQGGNRGEALRLLRPLIEESGELRARGRLVDELGEALSPEHAKELSRLTTEYTRELLRERMKEGNPQEPGKKLTMVEAGGYELVVGIGQEIRRAYERVFALQARDFDALIKKLALSPEQEGKVRQLVGDLFQKTYGKATKGQQTRVFLEVYAVLDADQRKVLLEEVRKNQGYRAANSTAGDPDAPDAGKSKPMPGKDEVPVPKLDEPASDVPAVPDSKR